MYMYTCDFFYNLSTNISVFRDLRRILFLTTGDIDANKNTERLV